MRRTGEAAEDFKLTASARRAAFVIVGDCLDKGPINLRLLRLIGLLRDRGARVKQLAGNHDIPLWLGMGAFLFIHAGLNDRVSTMIEAHGVGYLNRLYREQKRDDLFDFYYGPLANTMCTKYRPVDMP